MNKQKNNNKFREGINMLSFSINLSENLIFNKVGSLEIFLRYCARNFIEMLSNVTSYIYKLYIEERSNGSNRNREEKFKGEVKDRIFTLKL